MNKRGLREQVFKLLFRAEFNTPDEMRQQAQFYFESGDMVVTPKDQAYITDRCIAIVDRIPQLDESISDALRGGWKISRIGKVELTILRLAVYEIENDESVPAGVSINEAVELAKKFGQDGSGAFVNGILADFVPKDNYIAKADAGKSRA